MFRVEVAFGATNDARRILFATLFCFTNSNVVVGVLVLVCAPLWMYHSFWLYPLLSVVLVDLFMHLLGIVRDFVSHGLGQNVALDINNFVVMVFSIFSGLLTKQMSLPRLRRS